MLALPLGISVISTNNNNNNNNSQFHNSNKLSRLSHPLNTGNKKEENILYNIDSELKLPVILRKKVLIFLYKATKTNPEGFATSPRPRVVCRASQVVDIFPTSSPEVVVREARIEDTWEVAETHCSSFFPEYSFPLDFLLRIDRLMGMVFGFSVPQGCRRTCLVAVTGGNTFLFGNEDCKVGGGFDGSFLLNKGYVTGILTVDTVADFLPRKGPLRQRRTGIAYVSNVAVRERFRKKGIGRRLVEKAEAQAKSWNCHAIALHCDLKNPQAINLYKRQGFKRIKVPESANWPQPKTSPDVHFTFMMKLLNN